MMFVEIRPSTVVADWWYAQVSDAPTPRLGDFRELHDWFGAKEEAEEWAALAAKEMEDSAT